MKVVVNELFWTFCVRYFKEKVFIPTFKKFVDN